MRGEEASARSVLRQVWGLAVVASLFVSTATASAASPAIIEFAGAGSGTVVGVPPNAGEPPIECHWNGSEIDVGMPEAGKCESTTVEGEFEGLLAEHIADPGSEFGGWEAIEGVPVGCAPFGELCGVLTFGEPVRIRATFVGIHIDAFLDLSTAGSGSGSLACDTGSGAEPCAAAYVEGTEVTLVPEASAGSEFVEFTGDCSGPSCELTMDETHSVVGVFALETFSFSIEVIGEGTVECRVNGGGLGACPWSVPYGDEIELVATPNSVETVLASIGGSGSAAGCTESPCSFTITESSSVTAQFVSVFRPSPDESNVLGEVPQTTSLEAACEDVYLGEFLPGVAANYSNTCALVATSTGAETELSGSDESAFHTGHLVQGPYFLASPLEARAEDKGGHGGVGGPLAPLPSPATLLSWATPIGADNVEVEFNQPIGLHDPLHHGTYAKTIMLTLEQTIP